MKTIRSIEQKAKSDYVNMGGNLIRQPLPTQDISEVGPFLLLHHYDYEVGPLSPGLALSPHPHRGFEPVTFLFKGKQLHRDSLGNEGVLEAGDVQWMTAGSGVIHDEGAAKGYEGSMEGIQLWVNLPKKYKMTTPKYQDLKSAEIPVHTTKDGKATVKVVAGDFNAKKGAAETFTEINAFIIDVDATGAMEIPMPKTHEALIYLVDGEVIINNTQNLKNGAIQLLTFAKDGEGIILEATKNSKLLVLTGEPINEKITAWGPYVMNTQTEIMEAMRDFQQGKMGHLY